jgi:molybdate transport system substrate-binding protein
MTTRGLHSVSVLLISVCLAGCGNPSSDSAKGKGQRSTDRDEVVVFGAASTTNVLGDVCAAFERSHGIKVANNFASSAALAQQIINGAKADLFLSANVKWADAVENEGLVARRVDLLGNRLVVIVPADSRLDLRTAADMAAAPIERLALADPASVPAGIYAKQALERLGLWPAMEPKVVAGADVRQALAYVEQGAADAGIVYATDAAISKRVKIVFEIPSDATAPIVYPLLFLKASQYAAAAESLYAYLQSAEAAAVFERYGFTFKAADSPVAP